jgi:hypothetical protein
VTAWAFRWLPAVAAFLVAVTSALTYASAPSALRAATEYQGHLLGSHSQAIRFDVKRRDGQSLRAEFTVRNLPLVCEDGLDHQTFGPDSLRFVSADVFQGQRYRRLGDGQWSYYEVKGHILKNERARGYVYYSQDSHGPPEAENPDCNTGGQLYDRWRARRGER